MGKKVFAQFSQSFFFLYLPNIILSDDIKKEREWRHFHGTFTLSNYDLNAQLIAI
jgi:hypothetical protein